MIRNSPIPMIGAAKERSLVFRPIGKRGQPFGNGFRVGAGESVPLGRGVHVIVSSCVQAGVPEVLFDVTQVTVISNKPDSLAYRDIDDQSLQYQPVRHGDIITMIPVQGVPRRGSICGFQITLQPQTR